MSLPLLRSRATQKHSTTFCSNLSSNFSRRVLSTNPPKEPLSSFSSNTYDDPFYSPPPPPPPPTPPPPPPPSSEPPKRSVLATALKFGLAAAFTGLIGLTAYASFACTVEEVDKKTKAFRDSVNTLTEDDESTFSKLRTTVESAPAKAIEFYLDIRKKIEEQVREYAEPLSDKLLPDMPPQMMHINTLVLNLNETLVHSDWKRERGWRTFKRPGVDAFLEHLAQYYEIIVYTDSLQMYVDPIVERLDEKGCIAHRLSRAATLYKDGKHYRNNSCKNTKQECCSFGTPYTLNPKCLFGSSYVNDLSKLNRDPRKIIYISGNALDECLQPENCLKIKPWTADDVNDTTLLDLIPFLELLAQSRPPDVRTVLAGYLGKDVAKEFIERSKEYQRRKQNKQGRSSWLR